ncbi:MAG: hypothetical protein MR601_06035 [Erysipelotrichaceae bacterium]|nr:hypothetical protein [Erysipelotrichaceae bacterium]
MVKLLKYDFTQSYRAYGFIFSVFLVICFFSSFLMGSGLLDIIVRGIITTFVVTLLVLVVTNVIKFYNSSMFSDSGYLTLTLPVSTHKIVLSKIFTSALWYVIALFVLLLGTFISFIPLFEQNIMYIISVAFETIGKLIHLFFTDYNVTLFVLNIVLGLFVFVIKIFFVITAVQTKYTRKNKMAFGILLYVLLEFLISFVTSPFLETSFIGSIVASDNFMLVSDILVPTFFINIICIILFYFLTVYIIDNMIEI